MADHSHSLDILIQRQMGLQQPGSFQPDGRRASGPYLWLAIGQELRRARSAQVKTGTSPDMDAAARLRERLMVEAAGNAILPISLAEPRAEAAES